MAAITPAEARAYFARWAQVNEFEADELRKTPMAVNLRQLSAMMASRHLFQDDSHREQEANEARARWARLRKALGG